MRREREIEVTRQDERIAAAADETASEAHRDHDAHEVLHDGK